MTREDAPGPVKAWIEPDRFAVWRAFPWQTSLMLLAAAASLSLGYAIHPAFFVLAALSLVRHAAAEASLRELFRDGMLHPARVLQGARGLLATLVRLEQDGRMQDAVVVSRIPRRWTRSQTPWGGDRAAMVIAGNPPRLKPLSLDLAVRDPSRGRRATERIPAAQWRALDHALGQLGSVGEGVHPVELGSEPWYGSVRQIEVEGSLPAHLDSREPHAWCAGLPCVEQPTMVAEERMRVARLRTAARVRAAGLFASLGLTLAAATFVLLPDALRSLLASLVLVATPFVLLGIVRALRRSRAYTRDLADGQMWRFAGSLSNFDSLALDRDLALLARRGAFMPEPGVEQDMVVLRHARELLHVNGKWAPRGLTLRVSQVVAPPGESVKLALPAELRTERAGELDLGRRRLSAPEQSELGAHVQQLRKPGVAFLLLTPLALSVLLVWSEHTEDMQVSFASAPFVLALWLLSAQSFWRRLRLASRLRADAELGWVITVDHPSDLLAVTPEDAELPARGIESLLHARLDWTVNRRPASWRRSPLT
jgi:hypothetical protein